MNPNAPPGRFIPGRAALNVECLLSLEPIMKRLSPFLVGLLILAGPCVTSALAADAAPEPQLINMNPGMTEVITSLTTIVIFCALLAVLGKFAWGPILKGLQAREEGIRSDIEKAEASRKAAEKALAEYNAQLAKAGDKVREILDGARTDAEKIATSIRIAAQSEAEEIKERATREIEAAKNAALSEVYAATADLATSVAEKILRRQLNSGDYRDLVDQSVAQFEKVRA
jgi:F-type H+-transporting ATPase subunit b